MANGIRLRVWALPGIRTDPGSTFDALNRPLSLHGTAVLSNILGNRVSAGQTSTTWDVVNRLTGLSNSLGNTTYGYRADGMRVSKVVDPTLILPPGGMSALNGGIIEDPGDPIPTTNTTLYRYDGQMPIQEVRSGMSGAVVIDSALGARGVEAYSKRVGTGAATIGYPLYDAHGNNVATLTKGGSNSWSIGGTLRAYDAWGNVAGGALGDPSGRYCANLGHVQDDESGLVYMRARYYEPGTGRFISEDPAREGINWYGYADSNPILFNDPSGHFLGLAFLCTAAFLQSGLRTMKDSQPVTLLAAWIEKGTLKIGIDYIEKRVAAVGYDLLVKELSAIAATSGAASVQVQGFIASPGGQRFFERMQASASANGWPVEMVRNNNFTQLYWLFEAML